MTDKEKVIAFLTEMGIGFRENDGDIECHEGMQKVGGYANFHTSFTFDEDGALLEMGAYE